MAVLADTVTVTTDATLLVDPARSTVYDQWVVIVRNASGSTAYLGGADVTTAEGFPLPDGTSVSLNLGPHDALYGRVAASTAALNVLTTRYSP